MPYNIEYPEIIKAKPTDSDPRNTGVFRVKTKGELDPRTRKRTYARMGGNALPPETLEHKIY